jgi:hypothetical protein
VKDMGDGVSTPRIGPVDRREFARLTLITAATVVGGCAANPRTGPESRGESMPEILNTAQESFVGDYSTGDFRQWPSVQNRTYNGAGVDYSPTYSATVVDDPAKGKAARFEVRSGDVPDFGGGERSQVGADQNTTGGTEGQTRWYELSTRFDPNFPQNHADLGWGITNSWHPDSDRGSSPFQWSVGARNGYWSLVTNSQSAPGQYLPTASIFETPLNVGQWHDVRMQVHFSTSEATGWIRLWLGGARQTFTNGTETYFARTLIPGTTTVYYKEGYYRQAMAPTGVLYTSGFRAATDDG